MQTQYPCLCNKLPTLCFLLFVPVWQRFQDYTEDCFWTKSALFRSNRCIPPFFTIRLLYFSHQLQPKHKQWPSPDSNIVNWQPCFTWQQLAAAVVQRLRLECRSHCVAPVVCEKGLSLGVLSNINCKLKVRPKVVDSDVSYVTWPSNTNASSFTFWKQVVVCRDGPIKSADIWVLPMYRYRPKRPNLSASVGVGKTLLYSSRIQTTCSRKHNKASQDSYLAATLAGAFS